MNQRFSLALSALLALPLSACGMEAGTLQLTIYGEEFIEEGIPATVFHDGWSFKFEKFLVSVGELRAGGKGAPPALSDPLYRVVDLSKPSAGMGQLLLSGQVPGGAYDQVGYRIAPPPQSAKATGSVSAADLALLFANRYSLYVEGVASIGQGQTRKEKKVRFGFTNTTDFGKCGSTAVVDGAVAKAQITIHADHLFYDDLFAEEPNVAFALLETADADSDGEVTKQELQALDIRKQERYQVGSTGIENLWDFIVYQTSTVGHIDGEGHCDEVIRK